MLYLVGGAARVGKSKLARRLLAERGVPYLHLDLLMMGFARGLPKLGVDPETPAALRGEQLWPVVRGMAMTAVEDGVDYLFEGDLLLPGHAAELRAFRRDAVRAVFLGYSGITAEQKLRHIRASGGEPNDWVAGLADDRVLSIASTTSSLAGVWARSARHTACRTSILPRTSGGPWIRPLAASLPTKQAADSRLGDD